MQSFFLPYGKFAIFHSIKFPTRRATLFEEITWKPTHSNHNGIDFVGYYEIKIFDKKGLNIKRKNVLQSMVIKEPLEIDYDNEDIAEIVTKIEYAIEHYKHNLG